MKHESGVTLIELMVVVAIIGILSAIAYPSYVQYVLRANRADAKTVLLQNAQFMERKFTETSSYAGVTIPISQSPQDGAAVYVVGLVSNATTFTLTATPQGSQATGDACGALTLNQAGQKGADADVGSCWNK